MSAATVKLTKPQLYRLWVLAQHKYGWSYVHPRRPGALRSARALVAAGLVEFDRDEAHPDVCMVATDAGRAEVERRWPVSPFALGTYDHQPNGWDPPEGRSEGQDAR